MSEALLQQQIDELKARLNALASYGTPNLSSLANADDILIGPAFISPAASATSAVPTETEFTGVAQGGNGWTFLSQAWNWVLVKAGVLSVGANTEGDLLAGSGAIVINETGIDIGPGSLFLGTDGVLGDGDNIHLSTANFNGILSLTGSGGYSALATGAPAGAIYCMVKLGTDIYFGGSFLQMGGVRSPYFIKWDGSAFSKPYLGELNGAVLDMAVVGSDIYLVGAFTKLFTGATTGGTGTYVPSDIGTSVPGGIILGDSGGSGGYTTLGYIGKYNGTTVLALTYLLDTGANNVVRALAVNGTTLYAGGDFTQILGVNCTRVCAIDTTGPTASALSTGLDATCYSLIYDTDLYAGGAFTSKVRRYNAGSWAAWGTSLPNNTVYALAKSGNDVYAVGAFTSPASYIGKTTSGGAWGAVGAGLAGIGYAVAIDGTNIIAGFAGGENVQYWTGAAWTSLGTGVNSSVYALLVDTTWLIGGIYTTASGSTMYRISRYSTSTAPTEMSMLDMAEMVDDHQHYSVIAGYAGGTVAGATTMYCGTSATATAGNEVNILFPLPAGIVRRVRIYMATAQPGTGSLVVTLRKGSNAAGMADTSCVVTFAASAGESVGSDTTNTATYTAGQLASLKFVNNAGTASGSIRGWIIEMQTQ